MSLVSKEEFSVQWELKEEDLHCKSNYELLL
jgi:hypothetical protein